MKIGTIIQARTGSSRLPSKVLIDLNGKTVLNHVIERVGQSEFISNIIVATTIKENDDNIVHEADKIGVNVFRGSEDDVLERYYLAAKEYKLDIIIRITSDCPLIDSKVLDQVISSFLREKPQIATNAGITEEERTYPRGLDAEVFSFKVLEYAYNNANEQYQREHVTPYIYENSKEILYVKSKKDYSDYRWTLDTEEDLNLIRKIYDSLYHGNHDFYMDDILSLFIEKSELFYINSDIKQKNLK